MEASSLSEDFLLNSFLFAPPHIIFGGKVNLFHSEFLELMWLALWEEKIKEDSAVCAILLNIHCMKLYKWSQGELEWEHCF